MNDKIALAEENILHTYNRYEIVISRGEGVYLYDTEGKKYLDFFSGIGVYALGYGDKEFNFALKEQINKIMHTSNLFYNEPAIEASKKLVKISEMDKVLFTNSGAEAVEGALKAAVKYAYLKDCSKKDNYEIIALKHSFHGRTCGALSVTGKEAYREPFESLLFNVKFANMNDLQSVKALINENTCGIILETVQGEGGIYPATQEFLEDVYNICKERDVLLILDEVQCGMGRSGSYFAWQQYNVKPDIMTTAKALGNGVAVGAFLMNKKVASASMKAGDHGTTYGGNPFACQAVSKVLDIFEKRNIIGHVNDLTPYFEEKLNILVEKYSSVISRRGKGFMQGLELSILPADVVKMGLAKGIFMLTAGNNVLRLLPPLIIEKKHIDEMYSILDNIFTDIEKNKTD